MSTNQKSNGFNFYRIKTEWIKEQENGDLAKTKTEELVYASSYTEAEKVANQIIENENRLQMGSVSLEIIKTKIDSILYNGILQTDMDVIADLDCSYFTENEDSGEGLYAVKVIMIEMDPKTGKIKRQADTIYVPASSNADAAKKVTEYLNPTLNEFVIRDTKFDKAEAIYWPKSVYNRE